MSVVAKPLINSKFASAGYVVEYVAPVNGRTIIDKFSVTNTDVGAQTITVNIVPNGQSVSASTVITSQQSVAAGTSMDLTEMKNQILASGDEVQVIASAGSVMVIRASGREIDG